MLFVIYINDLPSCTNLFSLLFADDTTLADSDVYLQTLTNRVNIEFRKVTHYFHANKLSLQCSKTKFILVSNGKIHNLNIDIFINNNSPHVIDENPSLINKMERVDINSDVPAMRFLGVYFDPNFNFKFHVEKQISKLCRSLYTLRCVKNVLTSKALKSLYYS